MLSCGAFLLMAASLIDNYVFLKQFLILTKHNNFEGLHDHLEDIEAISKTGCLVTTLLCIGMKIRLKNKYISFGEYLKTILISAFTISFCKSICKQILKSICSNFDAGSEARNLCSSNFPMYSSIAIGSVFVLACYYYSSTFSNENCIKNSQTTTSVW